MSKGPKHNLPTVSSDIPRDLRLFIDRVAESLSGNGENRFVTAKELANAGVYDETDTSTDAGGEDPDVTIPVLTPPKPTLTASGGYEYVILSWPTPSYYGHSSTTVYRNTNANPTFDDPDTVAVTSVAGATSVFSDYLGTGVTATYWIQFVNINNVEGPVSDPATATTAINVAEVIDVLEGQLTSTEFVDYLSTFMGNQNYIVNAPGNYSVKVNADGASAGFGLSTTARDQGVEFDFAVLADNFFIAPPVDFNQAARPTSNVSKGDVWRLPSGRNTNNTPYAQYYVASRDNPTLFRHWEQINPTPFIVRTTDTTTTNADGKVIAVPAGVYIRDGFIQNGTITNAKIGEAAIDTAKIQDATITTAKVGALDAGRVVTGTLKSPNFTNEAGKAGFSLGMGVTNGAVPTPVLDDDGNLTFNNDGTIRVTYPAGTVNQEDVQFILRGAGDTYAALQLIDNVVTINALAIRDKLKSVSFDTEGTRGFKIDLGTSGEEDPGGFVHFRDNAGEDVFRIDETADGKGVVKMTGAAIRDAITSYNFDIDAANITTAGFHLGIGQLFDGTTAEQDANVKPKFYLYGKNGKLLLGVDGNTEKLGDRIANSAFISNQLANAQNINPFMTEPDFSKDDVIRPRGWYLYSSTNDGNLTYNTATELTGYPANTVLKLKSENNDDNTLGALSAAIRRDPKVSEYSVVITWRVEGALKNNGGLYFRAFSTSDEDFPAGQNVVTPAASYGYVFNNDEPTIVERMANGKAVPIIVVEDTYSGSGRVAGNNYQNVGMTSTNVPASGANFHTTKLKISFTGTYADTTYFSLDVLNWSGLGASAALYIDKVVVTPIALDVDGSDVTYNGTSLSNSTFAWLTEKIKSSNITTYFDNAAITEAIIGNAAVGTLKIQDNAVIVPAGDSSLNIRINASNYFINLSDFTTIGFWSVDEVPSALIVGGQVGYVGTDSGGRVSGAATAYVRLRIEWYSNNGTWVYSSSASNETMAVQSMQESYGGQAVTTAKIDVPTWSRGARLRIQGRNERYSGHYLRMATRYSFFAMAAKR
ncbi:MAG: hypothetical protein VW715_02430 [Rhodospirillales bacterium]